ncbi:MAG: hypothetical protein JHC39_04585 [Lentimicrobium sp.]|nr:hypothetical protein [Lentimicrobium sp.]
MHSEKFKDYQKYKNEWVRPESAVKRGVRRKANEDIDIEINNNKQPKTELVQSKLFRTVNVVTQATVDKLITNFIIKGMHALSTVEQPEFIELVTGLCASAIVLSRRTLGRRINDSFEVKMNEIKEQIAKVQTVCTTADIWSTPKRSFMGITCHWVDPELFIRKSVALACRRFTGAHTYNRIAELLCDINDEFGMSPTKIIATVTDNGANFVKAFKEFSVQVNFGAQIDDDTEISQVETIIEDNGDHDAVKFIKIFDLPDMESSSDFCNNDVVLPTHIRCSTHTLSLVATTDASTAIKNSGMFARLNHAAMGKCSALWNSCSRPKSAEKIFDICGCNLPSPCATRWNSMYDSLKGLLKKRDLLSKLMIELKLPSFKEVELEFLEEYCQILEPIAAALDRLQGDKNCFYADLVPTLFKVSSQLSALNSSVNWCHCLPLLKAITIGFNSRFVDFLQLIPKVNQAILATITHPYFKLRWLPQSMSDHRNRLQAAFVSEAKKVLQSTPHDAHNTSNSAESDDDYFGFRLNTSESANATTSSSNDNVGELEALQYLEDSRKDLSMLNNYPTIKQLFLRYNATLPSSAPVERLFSFAGIITRPHRRKLSDKLFEKLLLLKNN